jgi:hypothetical protein
MGWTVDRNGKWCHHHFCMHCFAMTKWLMSWQTIKYKPSNIDNNYSHPGKKLYNPVGWTFYTSSYTSCFRPSLTSLGWTSHFLDVWHLDQRTSVEWLSWTWVLNKVYGKYNSLLIICSHVTLLGTWFLLHSDHCNLNLGVASIFWEIQVSGFHILLHAG